LSVLANESCCRNYCGRSADDLTKLHPRAAGASNALKRHRRLPAVQVITAGVRSRCSADGTRPAGFAVPEAYGAAKVADMPNRALIAAATIVWALAVLVALIFGLPTLLTIEGVNVDIGLIVNALVAAGTFSAAAAAVWVATSDRRVRKQERDAEDEAQAKPVVISAQCQENPLELQIRVVNYGTRAITA
jgi:hypothetical protein